MSQAVEQGTQHWSSLVGHKKCFRFFFINLMCISFLLLRYFYSISNKPIIIINTSNIHSWHKVSNIRRCLDLWNGDIWCTLIIRNDSDFKAINSRNKTMMTSWALKTISRGISFFQRKFLSVLILMKITLGILLTYQSCIKSTFKMWLFWQLEWVTKRLAKRWVTKLLALPIRSQGLLS